MLSTQGVEASTQASTSLKPPPAQQVETSFDWFWSLHLAQASTQHSKTSTHYFWSLYPTPSTLRPPTGFDVAPPTGLNLAPPTAFLGFTYCLLLLHLLPTISPPIAPPTAYCYSTYCLLVSLLLQPLLTVAPLPAGLKVAPPTA